jgi:hypothetical protein
MAAPMEEPRDEMRCSSLRQTPFDVNYPLDQWSVGKEIHYWVLSTTTTPEVLDLITPDLVNLRNDKGWTPLHLVCSDVGNPDRLVTVERLLDLGADPHAYYSEYLPMHLAIRNGYLDVVRLFLERGTDPNLFFSIGMSCIQLTNNEEILKLLIDYGAIIQERSFVHIKYHYSFHRSLPREQVARLIEYFLDRRKRELVETRHLKQLVSDLKEEVKSLAGLVNDMINYRPDGPKTSELKADFEIRQRLQTTPSEN